MLINYCENCKFIEQRDVSWDYIQSGQGSFDMRCYVYSVNNTGDMTEYLNYTKILYNTTLRKNVYRGYLLDLGYIPLIMPPIFRSDWCDKYKDKVKIPYKLVQATSFMDRKYTGTFSDIWVHKLDAADFLGCKPTAVTIEKMIEGGII